MFLILPGYEALSAANIAEMLIAGVNELKGLNNICLFLFRN